MIHPIAQHLADQLALMPLADKITGLVKAARIKVADNQVATFPLAYNTNPTACTPSQLLDYCPDDTKSSIIYFEDLGSEQILQDDKGYKFAGGLRLVAWVNYKRLSGTLHEPSQVVTNLLKYLPRGNLGNLGDILGVFVEVIRQEPNDASAFARYTYQEETSQYLTYPYDYAALVLRVEWQVRPECVDDLTKTAIQC